MVSPKDQFYDPYNKILQSSPLCGWHWSMCIWNLQSISGMLIFKSIQKEFQGDLKIKLHVKDYIQLKVLNTWVWKSIQTLVINSSHQVTTK